MDASIRARARPWLACAIIIPIGLLVPFPAMAQTDSYLPLGYGNCWLFVSDEDPWLPDIRGMMVADTYESQGRHVCCVTDFFLGVAPGTIHLFDADGDTHERFRNQTELIYPWSDMTQPVEIPPLRGDCMHGARGHFAESGPITVPAGHFDDAVTIIYDELPCSDTGPSREVFARGVGLVERGVLTFAGVRTWSLVFARIDGISYGDPSFIARWQSGSPDVDTGAGDEGPGVVEDTWGGIKAHYR